MGIVSKKVEKELLDRLVGTKIGSSLEFPSIIPALPDNVQAFVMINEDNEYWVLEAFWHGISLGEVSAELVDKNLILEQL